MLETIAWIVLLMCLGGVVVVTVAVAIFMLSSEDQMKEHEMISAITLRDYFAANAMQALLTREKQVNEDPMLYAGAAYDVADAMLKAREE